MRFTTEILDEIRSLVPVSQVAGRKVALTRCGREWKGLSPFQSERTPSFTVNDAKHFYHCFSSGRHGDVFRFLMDTEGMSFPEAVETLAAEAGLELPPGPAEARSTRSRRNEILEALDAAHLWFRRMLDSEEGDDARSFLDGRSIGRAARERFGIGYAPQSWDRLRTHMTEMGFDDVILADAGLVGAGGRSLSTFDRFRDRVMLPIRDASGRLVGFGARALEEDATAKYLNTPETPVFRKGHQLYNLHRARAEGAGPLVIVEGYLDVVALDGAGNPKAVATMGTALTREQLLAAWRLCDEPVLLFDGDAAGRRAADRAIDIALSELQPGRSVRIGLLPDGTDPDLLVRDGRYDLVDEAILGARPLLEALWCRAAAQDRSTPERRAALETALHAAVGRIRHSVVRFHYAQEIAARLGPASCDFAGEEMRRDPLEAWVLAVAEGRPDAVTGMEAVFAGAGLMVDGRFAAHDSDAVPEAGAWALSHEVSSSEVAAMLEAVLGMIRRRTLLEFEAALAEGVPFAPCAPAT